MRLAASAPSWPPQAAVELDRIARGGAAGPGARPGGAAVSALAAAPRGQRPLERSRLPGRPARAGRALPRAAAVLGEAGDRRASRRRCATRCSPAASGSARCSTLAAARALGGDPRPCFRPRPRSSCAHLLPDPRRPAGDGRRRPAPRPPDVPHRLRRERRDPGRRRPDGRGLPADPRAPGGRAGAAAGARCGSCPTRSAWAGWWAASTWTSPATRTSARTACAACTR